MRPSSMLGRARRRFGRVANIDCSLFRRSIYASRRVVDDQTRLAGVVERHALGESGMMFSFALEPA